MYSGALCPTAGRVGGREFEEEGRSQILRRGRSMRLHLGQCGLSWALTGEVRFVLVLEISTYI